MKSTRKQRPQHTPARQPMARRRLGHRSRVRRPSPGTPTHGGPTSPAWCPTWASSRRLTPSTHSILAAIWQRLTDNANHDDLGGDSFAKLDPERAMRRIIRQANALGLTVRFDPIPDVA